RIALSLDPLSPIVNMNYGLTLAVARRFPEAIGQINKIIERDPTFLPAHFYLAQIYAMTGKFAEALDELRKSGNFKSVSAPELFSADAQGFLKMIQKPDNDGLVAPPANIAVCYAITGDRNKALDSLEKAYA